MVEFSFQVCMHCFGVVCFMRSIHLGLVGFVLLGSMGGGRAGREVEAWVWDKACDTKYSQIGLDSRKCILQFLKQKQPVTYSRSICLRSTTSFSCLI
jgi:hypothetical protein